MPTKLRKSGCLQKECRNQKYSVNSGNWMLKSPAATERDFSVLEVWTNRNSSEIQQRNTKSCTWDETAPHVGSAPNLREEGPEKLI